jgi:hypothetical protein
MPKIRAPKESLEGRPTLPAGIYHFRVDGFIPKKSKDGNSVNLQPKMRIINHATANDQPIFENLNSQAGWVQRDFCHALGIQMEQNGQPHPEGTDLPGEFTGPEGDPSQWKYIGPIVGRTGQVELHIVSNGKGGTKAAPKRYICAVPGCTVKHTETLS